MSWAEAGWRCRRWRVLAKSCVERAVEPRGGAAVTISWSRRRVVPERSLVLRVPKGPIGERPLATAMTPSSLLIFYVSKFDKTSHMTMLDFQFLSNLSDHKSTIQVKTNSFHQRLKRAQPCLSHQKLEISHSYHVRSEENFYFVGFGWGRFKKNYLKTFPLDSAKIYKAVKCLQRMLTW